MKSDALIIGAGPAGLCLSLAFAARGMQVDLIDRQPAEALAAPAFDGREIALTHRSIRLLRELGVWDRIPAEGRASLRRARVMDGADPGFAVDGAAFGRDRLGVLVSNHHIRAAAWQAAADDPRIRVHAGVAVAAVASDARAARVQLVDGRMFEAPLLVAADSRFSETRRALGIAAHMHDFGVSMLLCRMRHSMANDGTAWEWFGHAQTRALLPLDTHLSSVVLTVHGVEAQRLLELSPEAFAAEIAALYEGRLGDVELASTRHAYPLVATWARRFTGTRFALAGDAAVGMHPVTAHGFNLGLASIELLARAAGDGFERHGDPGDAAMLARYQRRHRIASAPLFAGTQSVAGLFTDRRPRAQPLRRALMRAGRGLPPLRRALAAGLVDETPRPLPLLRHARIAFEILRPRPHGVRT
ncbi:MAG: Ubiquinone biosynthesis hydroxylase, UbiH/UbiF/VisC/COQ6 family [Rhodanobacteraceae bacterium]|nr:MAG: Ubiquinone biosynthesis hydroxylase, UbiH/UbiF/VisC/COQ6 family [Rhodanobacteraceae bacterium]